MPRMLNKDCTFCQIVVGEIPAYIIDENEQVIVFLSLENHPLIGTKQHIRDIYSLPSELGAAIMDEAIKVSKALKSSLQCDGVYLTQANESAAGQDVFHYHLHLYPCWGDTFRDAIHDFVHSVVDIEMVTEEMKSKTANKLRTELSRL